MCFLPVGTQCCPILIRLLMLIGHLLLICYFQNRKHPAKKFSSFWAEIHQGLNKLEQKLSCEKLY